jgi:hypothetical protein
MSNKVPVLFIIFNRPDTTKKVFEAIRKYRPNELFIAADGPRENKPGEKERCEEARKITEQIDWPCEAKRLYRDKNFGCKLAVSGAIDWFFENVEEGIILEDDCLPDQTFFKFCEQMLVRYRDDHRVMHISGDNFQNGVHRGEKEASYYFSKYPHIWGWATWRRAWKKYDVKIKSWGEVKKDLKIINLSGLWAKLYWKVIFDLVNRGKIDTWDYQWLYACWINGGKTITPNINLVRNIGFWEQATHTRKPSAWIRGLKSESLEFPLVHPKSTEIDNAADSFAAKKFFNLRTLLASYFMYNFI